ncbi:MAG: cobalamin-binding protein [Anaerolineales bacterium]|jgi:5-methyltetrahydrofolate--homocysteine methyltransferase|nr:MAG: cobalamin-binding protein [Anaerolineales bacterium]
MNSHLESIYTAILEGDLESTREGVQVAINANIEPGNILTEGMIAAMKEVGKRFEEGDFYVPEMLISARAMKGGLSLLKPHLVKSDVKSAGKVAIGTVKGDLHDIGKNLVALMLEGAGFEVKDLGVDVSPEKFVEAINEGGAEIIALSALLTTTMANMKIIIETIQQEGLRDKVKIIIGGAPVTQEYANLIGADGYSADASQAVSLAQSFISISSPK